MMKLNDTQLLILSAASQRKDGVVILPDTLTGKAAEKLISALVRKQLIEAVPSRGKLPVWRASEDGQHLSLKITDKGLQALGIESGTEPADQAHAAQASPPNGAVAATGAGGAPSRVEPRAGSKQALVIEMLGRPEGATLAQIMAATGWQRHSVRGFLSGTAKKKLGLSLTSEPGQAGRTYRIGR